MDFLSLLYFACALNGVLLSVYLLSKKYHLNKSNYFLALFILIITGNLVEHFVTIAGYLVYIPHIMAAFVPFFFALGPLYFFYVRTLLNNNHPFRKLDWLHFAPTLICIILILPYYQLPGDYKYEQFLSFDPSLETDGIDFKIWFHLAFFIQCLVYSYHIIKALNNTGILEDRRTNRKVVAVVLWLRRFTYIFIVFIAGYMFTYWYITFQEHYFLEVFRTFNLLTSVFIYVIVYWSFRRSDLLNSIGSVPIEEKLGNLDLKPQIERFFKDDQLHLDPKLDLYLISRRLDINTQYLSKYINRTFNCSFTQLVNSYRIEEAKIRIQNPENDHLSLLGIGMEVGFTTKNTFTRAFQKHTGMTPSAYRKTKKNTN